MFGAPAVDSSSSLPLTSGNATKLKRRLGCRSPTKEEKANVIGTAEYEEARVVFLLKQEEERKSLEEESGEKPQVALFEVTKAEAAPSREVQICRNVFKRNRGDARAGQRCIRPASGKSGLCRVCQNSSKVKGPAFENKKLGDNEELGEDETRSAGDEENKQIWMWGLLSGQVVEAENDKEAGFTWPKPDEPGRINFTTYWMDGGGNSNRIDEILNEVHLNQLADRSISSMFLKFVANITVSCNDRIWWFDTESLMWTRNNVSVLLERISNKICDAIKIVVNQLPPAPPKPDKGEDRKPDPYYRQRLVMNGLLNHLSWNSKVESVYRLVVKNIKVNNAFEKLKNINIRYLPCAGGKVLDFETGEILPRTFHYNYDYEAPTDPSLATLESCEYVVDYFRHLLWRDGTCATGEMIRSFLTILGIFMSGDLSDQSILFLKGQASNGKSQLISILESTLGEAYVPASDGVFVNTDGKEPTPALTSLLKGARLSGISELNKSIRLSTALVKKLTSLEEFPYRPMYEEERKAKLLCHFIIATNTAIQFESIDEGVRRRVHCLEFPVRFLDLRGEAWTDEHRAENILPRRPEVIERMHTPECRAALLTLICHHWIEWKKAKLSDPLLKTASLPEFPGLENTTEEFIDDCASERSDVREFVAERLVIKPGSKLSTTEVLESYRSWSANPKATASWLKERLLDVSITPGKIGGKMYYKNVAFSTMTFPGVL
jgi:hypothetical protein